MGAVADEFRPLDVGDADKQPGKHPAGDRARGYCARGAGHEPDGCVYRELFCYHTTGISPQLRHGTIEC